MHEYVKPFFSHGLPQQCTHEMYGQGLPPVLLSLLHISPALEGATQRPFVGILQVTTHRQTTR